MEHITLAVSISSLAFILKNPANWVKSKLKIRGRIKPFDCPACLSFWFSLAYAVGYDVSFCIFAPIAYVIGAAFDRYL